MQRAMIWVLLLVAAMAPQAQSEEPVYFPDAKLKAAVERALGKTNPTPSDMLGLESLNVSMIADLTGVQYATNLTVLYLYRSPISDLTPLSGLTNLHELFLHENQISDLTPLSGLTNLHELYLWRNQISDLSPLSGLTNLHELILVSNQISDLSPLSGLANLQELYLSRNQISSLSPLSGLTNLTGLGLDGNRISDLAPLSGLSNVWWLHLENNQISDLSPLSGLTNPHELGLSDNQISDLSLLAGLTNLEFLYLENNQISDLSPLSGLANLRQLFLRGNPLNRAAYCQDLQAIANASPGTGTGLHLLFDAPNPNPPGAVSASDGAYTDKVVITWEALCPGPGRSDTFQYMVYRSQSLDGAKEAVSAWLDSTSFEDTTASPGVHFYYWLKSNHSTDFSDPDEGFAAGGPPGIPAEKRVVIFQDDLELRSDLRFDKANLEYGSSHPDVKKLQVILKHEGFFPIGTACTGNYYQVTKDAVANFQQARGLAEQHGIVGDQTVAELNGILDAECTLATSRAALICGYIRQFCHTFLPDYFPPELVLAIVAQESGGVYFDNMYVSDDCGRGIMQITSEEYFRTGSGVDCTETDSVQCAANPCESYYKNTVCGIEASIKDGLAALKDKYRHKCPHVLPQTELDIPRLCVSEYGW